mmetsp:Transcript_78240/g.126893  ORF Transcript_78240/g.126893 Transcript_78240/m.126893 type:complete len:207 (+) Transcript_78240:1237-1857(+)
MTASTLLLISAPSCTPASDSARSRMQSWTRPSWIKCASNATRYSSTLGISISRSPTCLSNNSMAASTWEGAITSRTTNDDTSCATRRWSGTFLSKATKTIFCTSTARISSGACSSKTDSPASRALWQTKYSSTIKEAKASSRSAVTGAWCAARCLALSKTACSKAGDTRCSNASQSANLRSSTGAAGTSMLRSPRPSTHRCMPRVS